MNKQEFDAFIEAFGAIDAYDNEGNPSLDRRSFKAGFLAGVRWEREHCAKIAENKYDEDGWNPDFAKVGDNIAFDIRARNEEK